MNKEDCDGIDINKLKDKLVEIDNCPPVKEYLCPCRGLTGELARKQGAEMAGCMHSGMTAEDRENIKRIQSEYDSRCVPTEGNKEGEKMNDINENDINDPFYKMIKESTPEDDEIIEKVLKVRSLIRQKHPPSDKFVEDEISCPLCENGKVHYSISDHVNGHIHAGCSTKGCLQWIE